MSNKKNTPKETDAVIFDDVSFLHKDVFNIVDKFYGKIQYDEILSVPFSSVGDWPEHIERLTNFWWIKLGGKSYMFSQYSPIPKHFYAGFNQNLLDRWLRIFLETLNENLSDKQIEVWSAMAHRMGKHLMSRNEIYKKIQTSKGLSSINHKNE